MTLAVPMKVSPQGRRLLIVREGVRQTAYYDTRGILTIGVGHTSAAGEPRVEFGMTLTMEEVDAILARDLAPVEETLNHVLTRPVWQNQFDAMASLGFNIGVNGLAGSSVVRQINLGNSRIAADDFLMWDRPMELLKRRQSERLQFLRPD